MRNMKIGARISTGFLLVMLLLALVAGVSVYNVNRLDSEINTLAKESWRKSKLLDEIKGLMDDVSISSRNMVMTKYLNVMKQEEASITRASEQISQRIDELDKMPLPGNARTMLDQIKAKRSVYRDKLKHFLDLNNTRNYKDAAALLQGEMEQEKKDYMKVVDELAQFQDKEVERIASESAGLASSTRNGIIVLGLVALVVGALLARYITNSITVPLHACVEAVEKLGEGTTSIEFAAAGQDEIGTLQASLEKVCGAVGLLVSDGRLLTEAALAGKLSTRTDATRHQGEYRVVIQGFNATLDAVIGPLNVSAEYMDRISKGDIPPRITESYNGDFNEIKNNLNVCIDAISLLVSDGRLLTEAALAGKLSTRTDASRHQGEFRAIIEGFNATLDAVVAPISDVRRVMEAMEKGDLSRRMTADARGDFAELKESLNGALEALVRAIANVTGNARQVASASAQTSGAVGQISDGSQNQLHAIGQVATAVKQTAASIADVARNTEEASLRAKDSVSIVNEGQLKMAQMVEVVGNISSNSEKINKITDVIEKIANKTNLLSLNAAIEAARAGEHGRGFAVVAEEVGKLAANAAESTQEIVALVSQAVREANHAVSTVNEVSGGMRRISEGALQTESMLQRISAALEEQSTAVQEINVNIASLNKVAESNAAASEEITATVVELAKLADNTRKEAEQFRL